MRQFVLRSLRKDDIGENDMNMGFDFTFENIEKLADIMKDKELTEISIEEGDVKITLRDDKKSPPPPPMGSPMPMQAVPGMTTPPPVSPAINSPIEMSQPTEELSGTAVKAPIVGTFYSRPRPDSSAFVTVGSKVSKGDVLYILETMKVMNEISAECDGVVSKILVKDGDTLEYGQTVMIIS